MATYWVTEVLPIPVTALIPVVMFPVLNVVPAKVITKAYINDTILLFIGGLSVAIAIERWNLHRKIALRILLIVGSEPRWLMFGLMISSWFLSMWISNTATTSMLVPIVEAILVQLKGTHDIVKDQTHSDTFVADNGEITVMVDMKTEKPTGNVESRDGESKQISNGDESKTQEQNSPASLEVSDDIYNRHYTRMCKALSLCICYAANAGGMCSLTGTAPNLVLKGQSDILYEKYGGVSPVNFGSWMGFGLPLGFIVLIITWVWLQIFFLRCSDGCTCLKSDSARKKQSSRVKKVIQSEYDKLGPVTFAQRGVLFVFALLVVLWISRDLGGIGGWGNLFDKGMVKDSTPSILCAILLFIIPSSKPDIFCWRDRTPGAERKPYKPLLEWKVVHEKMPWALFLLIGGGYALAKACEDSGLSAWVGLQLTVFKDFHPYLMLLILCYITAAATEVTSNTAIANLIIPIMSSLALNTGVNPLFYMFPTAIATSFAYMLPVATPPNAIVFSYGHLRVIDMVSAGFILNILAVPLLLLATATWGTAQFDFDVLPDIFRHNLTLNATI
ncbi:solute carrier family 13 member 5-like [Gigantopelta aegis]|uniref:solute carrier family 13 member 5-like n=1 Tax=Gigantopelta aegis TaxID=1735272 RepID=UPI001B88C493|nr:solute carrier family 13 member 5-like [Gigantopelta aegis]